MRTFHHQHHFTPSDWAEDSELASLIQMLNNRLDQDGNPILDNNNNTGGGDFHQLILKLSEKAGEIHFRLWFHRQIFHIIQILLNPNDPNPRETLHQYLCLILELDHDVSSSTSRWEHSMVVVDSDGPSPFLAVLPDPLSADQIEAEFNALTRLTSIPPHLFHQFPQLNQIMLTVLGHIAIASSNSLLLSFLIDPQPGSQYYIRLQAVDKYLKETMEPYFIPQLDTVNRDEINSDEILIREDLRDCPDHHFPPIIINGKTWGYIHPHIFLNDLVYILSTANPEIEDDLSHISFNILFDLLLNVPTIPFYRQTLITSTPKPPSREIDISIHFRNLIRGVTFSFDYGDQRRSLPMLHSAAVVNALLNPRLGLIPHLHRLGLIQPFFSSLDFQDGDYILSDFIEFCLEKDDDELLFNSGMGTPVEILESRYPNDLASIIGAGGWRIFSTWIEQCPTRLTKLIDDRPHLFLEAVISPDSGDIQSHRKLAEFIMGLSTVKKWFYKFSLLGPRSVVSNTDVNVIVDINSPWHALSYLGAIYRSHCPSIDILDRVMAEYDDGGVIDNALFVGSHRFDCFNLVKYFQSLLLYYNNSTTATLPYLKHCLQFIMNLPPDVSKIDQIDFDTMVLANHNNNPNATTTASASANDERDDNNVPFIFSLLQMPSVPAAMEIFKTLFIAKTEFAHPSHSNHADNGVILEDHGDGDDHNNDADRHDDDDGDDNNLVLLLDPPPLQPIPSLSPSSKSISLNHVPSRRLESPTLSSQSPSPLQLSQQPPSKKPTFGALTPLQVIVMNNRRMKLSMAASRFHHGPEANAELLELMIDYYLDSLINGNVDEIHRPFEIEF